MKMIIDIDDSDYERIKDLVETDTRYTTATTVGTAYQVIANGKPYEEPQGDLISRKTLKEKLQGQAHNGAYVAFYVDSIIDNAPIVEEKEEPFITECRDTAIKENLPLYFVYYEEIGVLEIYVTETKELFEKRRCSKHLPDYKFKEAVMSYLDWYSDWKIGYGNE